MKYEVETQVCATHLEDLKKDLELHIIRHLHNKDKSEDFAWHLNKINNKLLDIKWEIAQILPNENLAISSQSI
jgi:hypothetical protein